MFVPGAATASGSAPAGSHQSRNISGFEQRTTANVDVQVEGQPAQPSDYSDHREFDSFYSEDDDDEDHFYELLEAELLSNRFPLGQGLTVNVGAAALRKRFMGNMIGPAASAASRAGAHGVLNAGEDGRVLHRRGSSCPSADSAEQELELQQAGEEDVGTYDDVLSTPAAAFALIGQPPAQIVNAMSTPSGLLHPAAALGGGASGGHLNAAQHLLPGGLQFGGFGAHPTAAGMNLFQVHPNLSEEQLLEHEEQEFARRLEELRRQRPAFLPIGMVSFEDDNAFLEEEAEDGVDEEDEEEEGGGGAAAGDNGNAGDVDMEDISAEVAGAGASSQQAQAAGLASPDEDLIGVDAAAAAQQASSSQAAASAPPHQSHQPAPQAGNASGSSSGAGDRNSMMTPGGPNLGAGSPVNIFT
ncbi:unnamed protein product [Amoebophrya sp. A120]|nr:unnamed protein product [Amoebophrya sp. A120]|eukprot:GSA120T00020958001.1